MADHIGAVLQLADGPTLDPRRCGLSGSTRCCPWNYEPAWESGLDIKLAANFVWKHPTVVALANGIGEHIGLELNGEEDSDSGN